MLFRLNNIFGNFNYVFNERKQHDSRYNLKTICPAATCTEPFGDTLSTALTNGVNSEIGTNSSIPTKSR